MKEKFINAIYPIENAFHWSDRVSEVFGPEACSEVDEAMVGYISLLLNTYFPDCEEEALYERFYETIEGVIKSDGSNRDATWEQFYREFKGA